MADDNDKGKFVNKILKGKSLSRSRGGGKVDEIPKDTDGKGDYGALAEKIKQESKGKTFAERVRPSSKNASNPNDDKTNFIIDNTLNKYASSPPSAKIAKSEKPLNPTKVIVNFKDFDSESLPSSGDNKKNEPHSSKENNLKTNLSDKAKGSLSKENEVLKPTKVQVSQKISSNMRQAMQKTALKKSRTKTVKKKPPTKGR